jgi:hypothetical protein
MNLFNQEKQNSSTFAQAKQNRTNAYGEIQGIHAQSE